LEIEIMNLMMCNVFYFPVTAGWLVPKDVPFFRARYKSAILAEIQRHRSGVYEGLHRLFTLPWNLPYDSLNLRELLCVTQLYREGYRGRMPFTVEMRIEDLGRHCGLSRQKTSLGLSELEDKKLIRMTRLMQDRKLNEWGTRIELCDPEGSGKTLFELAGEHEAEFRSKTIEEWYSLMLYGEPGRVHRPKPRILIDPGDPAQMGRYEENYPCPLTRFKWVRKRDGTEEQKEVPCNGVTSKDRGKLRLKFFDTPNEYGKTDAWHCFKCNKGGDCHSLWLRLWPKLQERLGPQVYVGSYERLKEERQRAEVEEARAEIKAKARRVLEGYEQRQSRRTETTDH
jgi:hypothetical protein